MAAHAALLLLLLGALVAGQAASASERVVSAASSSLEWEELLESSLLGAPSAPHAPTGPLRESGPLPEEECIPVTNRVSTPVVLLHYESIYHPTSFFEFYQFTDDKLVNIVLYDSLARSGYFRYNYTCARAIDPTDVEKRMVSSCRENWFEAVITSPERRENIVDCLLNPNHHQCKDTVTWTHVSNGTHVQRVSNIGKQRCVTLQAGWMNPIESLTTATAAPP